MRAFVVAAAACIACASTDPRNDPPPTTIAAASTTTTTTTAAAPATTVPPALASLSQALQAHAMARVVATLTCETKRVCAPIAPLAVDDAAVKAAFAVHPRDVESRALQASLARAVIDDALAASAAERNARRRALTFSDAGAVFAFDDVDTLLAQAAPKDRPRVLNAASPAVDVAAGIDAERRAIVENVALRAGISRGELIARRAGLDEAALRKLVEHVLTATASLLPPADATSVLDIPVVDNTAAAVDGAKITPDPIFIDAYSDVAALRVALRTKLGTRALVVDVRRYALATLAVLDAAADTADKDALAARIVDDNAAPVKSASFLLPADASGVVVERFIAALRAPQLAEAFAASGSFDDAWRKWNDAPPVEQQGFPEAFVDALRVLPELVR